MTRFTQISAPKGIVKFRLRQNEIQNNLAEFVKTPVAVGFEVKCRISRDKRGVDRGIFPTYFMHMEINSGEHRVRLMGICYVACMDIQ